MATASVTYTFSNGTNADATQVNSNFTSLVNFINTEVIQRDASTAFTAVPTLPADPSISTHAVRKGYVDAFFPVSAANLAAGAVIAGKIAAGAIVNSDVSATAAIALSKIATTGAIVNADINAAAAIAYSKLNLATSLKRSDLSTAAGELGGSWQSGTATFSNVTAPTYDLKFMLIGPKTLAARFTFTGGTVTGAGPATVNFSFAGMTTFAGVNNYHIPTVGGTGANVLAKGAVAVGTASILLYLDVNGTGMSASQALNGYGFNGVFEIA